jgi:hypothetical protein
MPAVSDITAVNITLSTGEKQALFILLDADGSINRLGTGSVANKDDDLFIGVTKEPLFAKLMGHLDDEMLKYMGGTIFPISEEFRANFRSACCLRVGRATVSAFAMVPNPKVRPRRSLSS